VRRDLLVPVADGRLRFRHDLVREAAYASLAKSARAGCTRAMPNGWTGWAPTCPRPTRGSASTSRPRASTSRRSGYADAERMLSHARRAGSGFDVGTALIFLAWALVEGPWPTDEALARCDALTAEAAGQRGAELNLRGCRAVAHGHGGGPRARHDMAEARAGLAELHLGVISAYLALLDAIAETLAGDPAAAERAVRDAEAIIVGSGTRWYQSLISADLALAILAQHRPADAAEAVARIETLPAPCDTEWVIKRHMARALLAAEAGEPAGGVADARKAVAVADASSLIVCGADAHRTLAGLLWATDWADAAADHARRALRLDEAKGNRAAATATRRRFAPLLAPHPGVQTQEGVKSCSYTDD
jgi:hypothetical protein